MAGNWLELWRVIAESIAGKRALEERAKEIAKQLERDKATNKWGWGKWWVSEKSKN